MWLYVDLESQVIKGLTSDSLKYSVLSAYLESTGSTFDILA